MNEICSLAFMESYISPWWSMKGNCVFLFWSELKTLRSSWKERSCFLSTILRRIYIKASQLSVLEYGLCGRGTTEMWVWFSWLCYLVSLGKLFSLCLTFSFVLVRLSCLPCAWYKAAVNEIMLLVSNVNLMPITLSSFKWESLWLFLTVFYLLCFNTYVLSS